MPDGEYMVAGSSVLFGADKKVAAYVLSRFPGNPMWEQFKALGVVRHGALIGGVVFHNYHPAASDIEISAAFDSPLWCLPRTVEQLFSYPIAQLKCQRITARTSRRNKPARSFLERLGFRVEGVLRRAHDGKQDVILYGLLIEQSSWLKG